jgi:hypothetical protein
VSVDNPRWKEAFLRPRDAFGTVIQVAEQSGPPPELAAPADLGLAGPPSMFTLIDQYVDDIGAATGLFESALDGEVVSRVDTSSGSTAELTWPNGSRLRLRTRAPGPRIEDGLGSLRFSRDDRPFSPHELSRAADLSRMLGVCVELRS